MSHSSLNILANPAVIALFGASPAQDSLGGGITRNLLKGGFSGRVHLINPKYREIDGYPCHDSLADIDPPIDLALIATPAETVPAIIEQCGSKGVKTAIIHSAGFAETGSAGAEAEARLLARARHWGIRLLGPRALGFIRPHLKLNATPFQRDLPEGNLAFVSQSGVISTGILDWVFNEDFSLSALFSLGSGSDLNLPEILDFLACDPRTESILLYLEAIRDSRRFMSALRAAARIKPVVVVKAGRTPTSAAAAQARNQAPACADDAFDAALRRAGALRVRSLGDLFSAARALTTPRRPEGNRLAIVTNGGGPAIMAEDGAADRGIELPVLGPATVSALKAELPHSWSVTNPVDVLFGADPRRFAAVIRTCLADQEVDAVLAILTSDGFLAPSEVTRSLIDLAGTSSKPLLVCCTGETSVREARHLLAEARVPVFRNPETAITAFAFMVDYVRNQRLLLETPPSLSSYLPPDVAAARSVIDAAQEAGRRELDPAEIRQVLACFHIPVAADPGAAPGDLRIAIRTDGCFGPVISVGLGGAAAELQEARATVLPPLNSRLIHDLFLEKPVARLLAPQPDRPTPCPDALRHLLLRISELASELPWIQSLEMAPIAADSLHLEAAGVRMTIRPAIPDPARYTHMAICPYPMMVETHWQTREGMPYHIRPIRPEDAAAFQDFVRDLSNLSKHYRFFGTMRELPLAQLARKTQVDYDREMVLVAVCDTADGRERILAEASYGVLAGERAGEFAVVVADQFAGQGIGSRIMKCLMDTARARGLTRLVGEVLSQNEPMQALMASLGFHIAHTDDPDTLELSKQL